MLESTNSCSVGVAPLHQISYQLHCVAVELAWAAGLFDGEGCISISKQMQAGRKNPTYRLRLDVCQNNRETLQRFRGILAGQGAIGHFYEVRRTTLTNRQVYILVYDGSNAAAALSALLPYLVRKRPEAEVALEYMQVAQVGCLPGPRGLPASVWKTREAYRRRLQRMK